MNTKRTHVIIPDQLVREIDQLVGSRKRSSFITQAAERELTRMRQLDALRSAAGSWKNNKHPELKEGSAEWVRKMRQETERRFQKVTKRS